MRVRRRCSAAKTIRSARSTTRPTSRPPYILPARALRALRRLRTRHVSRRPRDGLRGDPPLPRRAELKGKRRARPAASAPSLEPRPTRRSASRRCSRCASRSGGSCRAPPGGSACRSARPASGPRQRSRVVRRRTGASFAAGAAALTAALSESLASVAKLGAATSSAPRAANVARRFISISSPHSDPVGDGQA